MNRSIKLLVIDSMKILHTRGTAASLPLLTHSMQLSSKIEATELNESMSLSELSKKTACAFLLLGHETPTVMPLALTAAEATPCASFTDSITVQKKHKSPMPIALLAGQFFKAGGGGTSVVPIIGGKR